MKGPDSARRFLLAGVGAALSTLLLLHDGRPLAFAQGVPQHFPSLQLSSTFPAHTPTLTGSVRQTAYQEASTASSGVVLDSATGQPLEGVQISLPALGQDSRTNAAGQFSLPDNRSSGPIIASFSKPGYLSASATIRAEQSAPLQVRLQRFQANTQLVLDDQLRRLGDNSYSPHSAGAARFRKTAEGAVLRHNFQLSGAPEAPYVTLRIGTVLGLDTRAAHAQGQSGFHHASTPMLVRLNGQVVNRIELNGDGISLRLPSALLREHNTLALETGYNIPDGTYVDYDDVEVMHLVLEF